MILDVSRLPYQLVQTLLGDRARSIGHDVGTVIVARRSAINTDAEPHRLIVLARSEDEVKVPRMESVNDFSSGMLKRSVLAAYIPESA